jgi:hypothetical protein
MTLISAQSSFSDVSRGRSHLGRTGGTAEGIVMETEFVGSKKDAKWLCKTKLLSSTSIEILKYVSDGS